ncbi:tyrosine-type recombinase/integrase [Kordia sp.]|uniref:tyrosine-type recombinase/integrase n=1 Tax=Kordia sp. TaxID=1965332 RepID=UPI003D2DC4A5
MAKKKKLPNKKHKGLYIYCSVDGCKKNFSWTNKTIEKDGKNVQIEPLCKLTNRKFSNCKNFQFHKYKSRLHVPGTKSGTISKVLDAENYKEAVVKAVDFENEFKGNVESSDEFEFNITRYYLLQSQKQYIYYLENIDVAEHKKVERSQKYIDEILFCLKLFNESLRSKKIKPKFFLIEKVTDIHVGYFHKYLLDFKGYKNKTYNNKMTAVKGFFKWAIKEYKLNVTNPFDDVKKRSTIVNKDTITKNEFKELLEIISPESGFVQVGKSRKNRYKPYLKDGIELALHTGGRREEIVELKWNMIKVVDDEPSYIVVPNLKVLRQKGEGFNDNVAPKIIPITQSLKKLLLRLGYNENMGSHEYILSPDRSKTSTNAIMNNLSKGFSHYYKQLNTDRNLQFKNLRKTYLTHLASTLGGEAKSLSSHSSDEVLQRHYINKKIVSKAVKEMEIFE